MIQPKPKKPISPGAVLLLAAAMVQGVQYVYAFTMIHNSSMKTLAIVGGILAGLVVVGVVAYAGGRLPVIKAKRARVASWTAFLILLVVSPLILTPINWYTMDTGLRASIGGYSWVLAGLIASVPELAMALVAFADRDLIPGQQATTQSSTQGTEGTTGARASKKKQAAHALLEECSELVKQYACTEKQCQWSPDVDALVTAAQVGKNPKSAAVSAKAGHMKNKHPKPIQIDTTLLLKDKAKEEK